MGKLLPIVGARSNQIDSMPEAYSMCLPPDDLAKSVLIVHTQTDTARRTATGEVLPGHTDSRAV